MKIIKSTAIFDDDQKRKYRYELIRVWDSSIKPLVVIGLNPSIADETRLDPTVTRCKNRAIEMGMGGLVMLNIFALVSTDPGLLLEVEDPVGQRNDEFLKKYSKGYFVLAAWGNHGSLRGRSSQVKQMFSELYCLDKNMSGEPKHPLYVANKKKPKLF